MSRHRMPQAVALFVALTVLAVTPASAQFGGLAKKAKQAAQGAAEKKVEQKADDKVNDNLPRPAAWGEELTESSFGDLMRGLNAELADGERRYPLRAEAQAKGRRIGTLKAANDRGDYDRQLRVRDDCLSAAQKKFDDRVGDLMVKKAMDPKFQASYKAMVERYEKATAKAQKANDTEAQVKATIDYTRDLRSFATGNSFRDDSLAIDRQCPKPVEPAWLTEVHALDLRVDTLNVLIRGIDDRLVATGSAASGMTPASYALAKERVFNWAVMEFDKETAAPTFSTAERKLFERHKVEIKKVYGILEATQI